VESRIQEYDNNGSGVRVYVVDSGIRLSHHEFVGRVVAGATFVNDGLGVDDCTGHGTQVAGIIGGSTFGVAKGVTLVPVRVVRCNGKGFLNDVIAGISPRRCD